MDPRHTHETSRYLAALAHQLGIAGHHPVIAGVAKRLHELADRQLVALPTVNPQRDDLRHWTELSDYRLASEIHADAWNLAAGIAVQRDRELLRQVEAARRDTG